MAESIKRAKRKPVASAEETRALKRIEAGTGTDDDITSIRLLIDRCGRYGCVFTKCSHSSAGMDTCPGWCDVLDAHDAAVAAREAACKGRDHAKPRKLTRAEKAAFDHAQTGELTVSDMLAIELLCRACKLDGCAREDDLPGITCPGWCNLNANARLSWWGL